jgi:hypothetical protein
VLGLFFLSKNQKYGLARMSQLLERLQAELVASGDPIRRAELVARIAGYFARIGKFDESRACIADLRAAFGKGQDGRVTIWIMLAEGLLQLFEELSPSALDRISRALLLATATKYGSAIGLLAAWKAHIEFELALYDAAFQSLGLGLSAASADDLDAQTRIAIVLSNLYMLAGDGNSAQAWFLRGHDSAVKNGDQASIEALLYNRVAFRLSDLRAQSCRGRIVVAEVTAMRVEVESAKNLQELTRVAALTNHIRLVAARLSLLEGKFDTAMERLLAVRGEHPFAAHNFNHHLIDLEIAFCRARTSGVDDALCLFQGIDFTRLDQLDLDERLVAAWTREKLAANDSRFGDPLALGAVTASLSDEYGVFQSNLRAKLAPFADRCV